MANSFSTPIVAEQFVDAFNRNIDDFQRNIYDRNPPEYQQVVKVEQATRWTHESTAIQGIAKPTKNRDLESLPLVSPVKGNKNKIQLAGYRSQIIVEQSALQWAEHREIFDNTADCVESAKTLTDKVAINMFNNGFSTQAATDFTEADGTQRSLFNTGHYYEDLSGTFSNYYNVGVPPNPDTLYNVISTYLQNLKDAAGNFIDVGMEFTIVTPIGAPDYRSAADRLVMSNDDPTTANRAVNTVNKSFKLSHICLKNLTSTTKWFIICSPSKRFYPVVMKMGTPANMTPLEPLGAVNPHAYASTLKTEFGVGLRGSARGVVAIGT